MTVNDRVPSPSEADASPMNSLAAPSSSWMVPVASRSPTEDINGEYVWLRRTENVSMAASTTSSSSTAIRIVLLITPGPKDNVASVAAV